MIRMASTPVNDRHPQIVRLSVRAVYFWVASLMLIIGLAFSTAALAAGVTRIDLLALLFAMGAAGALLALVVWYLLQLRPPSA
jgi:hypothetical protein